ncbi:DUF3231 family protein [Lysinibacillus piscis]|uniref:DUF3231 family protein n=1 Tax=Lysinibacillus piscis TaxID=2518931 RepID=A0ABQ5NLM6_9BACI|nr:DUF3231 family protein [Lysinibacillus sp. KH24]GLC89165.1 hypothetical protein LYSBPC_22920 [Lysinibacillus sp. KH24]
MHIQKELRFQEIFKVWTQLSTNHGYIATNHTFFHQVTNKQLQYILLEFIHCLKDENRRLQWLLQDNGIVAPQATQPPIIKKTDRQKLTMPDAEISAILSMNIAACLLTVSQIDNQQHAALFHMRYASLGAKLIELSQQNGWL